MDDKEMGRQRRKRDQLDDILAALDPRRYVNVPDIVLKAVVRDDIVSQLCVYVTHKITRQPRAAGWISVAVLRRPIELHDEVSLWRPDRLDVPHRCSDITR